MSISASKLFPLLNKSIHSNEDMVADLVREIMLLQAKLDEPEKQSFFFRKSMASHAKRLQGLKKEFEQLKTVINSHQLEEFLEWKSEAEKEYKRRRNTAAVYENNTISALYERIKHMGRLVNLKSKYSQLNSIEDYLGSGKKQRYLLH